MRPLRWILAGLALYLGALLATLPAPWAWWALDRWLPHRDLALPRLHGLAGSLWEGEARLALWRGWRLEGLRWELHPAALLAGRAEARLALEAPARGAGVLAWSPGAWQARELRLELGPEGLAALLARAPGGRLLALDGRVVAEVARLRLAAAEGGRWRAEEAEGTLVWTGAGLRRPVAVALGAFRGRLEAEDGALLLRFRDAGGPLEAQGTLRLDLPRRRYRLEAALALRESSRTDLAQALRLLGRPGPDGRFRLRQEGPAPFLP